jgi:hypothetical protein
LSGIEESIALKVTTRSNDGHQTAEINAEFEAVRPPNQRDAVYYINLALDIVSQVPRYKTSVRDASKKKRELSVIFGSNGRK